MAARQQSIVPSTFTRKVSRHVSSLCASIASEANNSTVVGAAAAAPRAIQPATPPMTNAATAAAAATVPQERRLRMILPSAKRLGIGSWITAP